MPEDNLNEYHTPGTSRTGASRLFAKLLSPIDRLFNKVYSSRWNPLYQSGPLAVGLLLIVLVTGIYLLLFYRLGTPYESVDRIQSQVWLGRWIRALHRYASDAALVAVIFHILRIVAQGKTWGPRALAWISGVILTLAMFLSAWTGYVMVWDEHGQWIATLGARILDRVPLVSGSISSGFSGAAPLATSFFFMNLFLHVAIPLGIIVILWIHTAKLARSRWLPSRPVFMGMTTALVLVAILWPAPLETKANLLAMRGRVITDLFYGFWMPFAERSTLWGGLLFWVLLIVTAISVPFWLRPPKSKRPPASFNDPDVCIGCGQCKEDCPYEAITMIPRAEGHSGSATFAQVDPGICVSCGICSASCSTLTIGPPGRKASEAIPATQAWLERLAEKTEAKESPLIVAHCRNNHGIRTYLNRLSHEFLLKEIDCAANLHAKELQKLTQAARHVAVISCPSGGCLHREGLEHFHRRLSGEQQPAVWKGAREKITPISVGAGEETQLYAVLCALKNSDTDPRKPSPSQKIWVFARRALATAVIAILIAAGSRVGVGTDITHSAMVRLSWRLNGQTQELCRDRTQQELDALPVHMRTPQVCQRIPVNYVLSVSLNGKLHLTEVLVPAGVKGDRPIAIEKDIRITPGDYLLEVRLAPQDENQKALKTYEWRGEMKARSGEVRLLTTSPKEDLLILL